MDGHEGCRALAALVEGPIVVFLRRTVPRRFCMSQEENGLHGVPPEKPFLNNGLMNCHDMVM
jgi:hypothetical protein